jgi:hypothetical protein
MPIFRLDFLELSSLYTLYLEKHLNPCAKGYQPMYVFMFLYRIIIL